MKQMEVLKQRDGMQVKFPYLHQSAINRINGYLQKLEQFKEENNISFKAKGDQKKNNKQDENQKYIKYVSQSPLAQLLPRNLYQMQKEGQKLSRPFDLSKPETPTKDKELKELRSKRLRDLVRNFEKPLQKKQSVQHQKQVQQNKLFLEEEDDFDYNQILEGKRYRINFPDEKGESKLFEEFDENNVSGDNIYQVSSQQQNNQKMLLEQEFQKTVLSLSQRIQVKDQVKLNEEQLQEIQKEIEILNEEKQILKLNLLQKKEDATNKFNQNFMITDIQEEYLEQEYDYFRSKKQLDKLDQKVERKLKEEQSQKELIQKIKIQQFPKPRQSQNEKILINQFSSQQQSPRISSSILQRRQSIGIHTIQGNQTINQRNQTAQVTKPYLKLKNKFPQKIDQQNNKKQQNQLNNSVQVPQNNIFSSPDKQSPSNSQSPPRYYQLDLKIKPKVSFKQENKDAEQKIQEQLKQSKNANQINSQNLDKSKDIYTFNSQNLDKISQRVQQKLKKIKKEQNQINSGQKISQKILQQQCILLKDTGKKLTKKNYDLLKNEMNEILKQIQEGITNPDKII